MADTFTSSDTATLLSRPGFFYYREHNSDGAWKKAVFANGAEYTPNTETTEIAFDDVGTVRDEVSDETVDISISSGRVLDFDFINDLTGGLYTKEVTPGTLVSGAEQTIKEGWAYDAIVLFANQNGDGSAQAVSSVEGAVDGALVEGVDYDIVALPEVGYGLFLKAGGAITTLAQAITVTYDYTPNAMVALKRGGTKIVKPIELAFQTVTEDGDYVQFFFYKAYTDGADGHSFSPENSAEAITMDLSFTAKKDANRASGDQLMSKVKGGSALITA